MVNVFPSRFISVVIHAFSECWLLDEFTCIVDT